MLYCVSVVSLCRCVLYNTNATTTTNNNNTMNSNIHNNDNTISI